jgi:hypothetical protein
MATWSALVIWTIQAHQVTLARPEYLIEVDAIAVLDG